MPADTLPPVEQLRQLFRLDPETGRLFWRERPDAMFATPAHAAGWNTRYAGAEALRTVDKEGYKRGGVFLEGKRWRLLAARVVLAMTTGHEGRIADHVNGDVQDNRPENLRWVNDAESCANRRVRRGKMLPKNVFSDKSGFRVLIRRGAKRVDIWFKHQDQAEHAARSLLVLLDGDFAAV